MANDTSYARANTTDCTRDPRVERPAHVSKAIWHWFGRNFICLEHAHTKQTCFQNRQSWSWDTDASTFMVWFACGVCRIYCPSYSAASRTMLTVQWKCRPSNWHFSSPHRGSKSKNIPGCLNMGRFDNVNLHLMARLFRLYL